VLVRLLLILALLPLPAVAAVPSTCGGTDGYAQALCAYQRRQFGEAEKRFREIAESGAERPETIRALYFLARTLMKTGRYEPAAETLRRIYDLDKPFYDAWSCDYLLGECRRAQGKG
jgi:TolA-binding protein